jgi:hypothetical protein
MKCAFQRCCGNPTVLSSCGRVFCKSHGQLLASLYKTLALGNLNAGDVEITEIRIQDFFSKVNETKEPDQINE